MDDQEIGKKAAQTAREETIAVLRWRKKTRPVGFVEYLIKSLDTRKDRLGALKLLADIYELTSNVTKVELPEKVSISFKTDFGTEDK